MGKNLRILFIEDSEDDALILQNEIRRGGFDPVTLRVESEDDMRRALDYTEWDLIISDERMPRLNAMEALKISIESGKDIPFIIVSGKIEEEAAVAAMKSGAHDYINKNNLARLVPAIERELADASERKNRRRMELALQKSEARYRMLFEKMMDAFVLYEVVRDEDGTPSDFMLIDTNDAFSALTGISHKILIGTTIRETDPELPEEFIERFNRVLLSGNPEHFEYYSSTFRHYLEVSAYRPREGLVATIVKDVSSIKIASERQELVNHILETLNREDNTSSIIEDILGQLKHHYGFDAVAMRLKQGDDFPYFLYNGFSENFIESASLLCIKNESGEIVRDDDEKPRYICLCGLVISGKNQSGQSLLTQGGSFWTNSLSELLDEAADELSDLKMNNHCLEEGYESLALIPLRSGDETIGMLQFNDSKKNRFTHDMIEFLESVGLTVGIALKRRQLEDEIRERERIYRLIADNMSDAIWLMDMNFKYIYVTPSMVSNQGFTMEEMNTMPLDRNIMPESFSRLSIALEEELSPERLAQKDLTISNAIELELIRKNGTTYWIDIHYEVIRNQGGVPEAIMGVSRDITDRKHAEEALCASEARYRTIIDNIEDGYYEVNLDGNLVFFNDSLSKIYGYTRDELAGMNYRVYMNEESGKKADKIFTNIYNTGQAVREFEWEFIKKDKSRIYVEISISLIRDSNGAGIGYRGIVRDITERRQMEDALRKSEEKYRTILVEIQEGYFENDLAGNFTFINDSMCRIWGRTRNEFIGMNYRQYTDKETAEKVNKAFAELYRTGEPIKALEEEIIRKDGTRSVSEISASLMKNSKGEPVGFRGMARDITDRRRAEEARRESEERYRMLFNSANDAIFVHEVDEDSAPSNFVEANDIACMNLGYTRDELFELSPLDIDVKLKPVEISSVIKQGAEKGTFFETVLRAKNGTLISVEMSLFLFKLKGKTFAQSIARDITERKLNEDRMLASLREKEVLLKEIHHRVKNNLQVISSLMGLQSSHIKKGQDAQAALQNMQNRIKSMAIVHEKLYQSQNFAVIDFQEYIKSIIANIFQSLLLADGRISLKVDAEQVSLGVDRAVPCGLIFNELITNAIKHAFPAGRGGEITAGIRRSEDGLMTMFVKDDGIGLPKDFDIDSAPSLGLKLVRILTQQIDGELITRTDKGTTFTITFKDDGISKK